MFLIAEIEDHHATGPRHTRLFRQHSLPFGKMLNEHAGDDEIELLLYRRDRQAIAATQFELARAALARQHIQHSLADVASHNLIAQVMERDRDKTAAAAEIQNASARVDVPLDAPNEEVLADELEKPGRGDRGAMVAVSRVVTFPGVGLELPC